MILIYYISHLLIFYNTIKASLAPCISHVKRCLDALMCNPIVNKSLSYHSQNQRNILTLTNLRISNEIEAYRVSKYAGAAYCLDEGLKAWSCNHCKSLGDGINVHQIFSEPLTGGRGFIALDKSREQIILSFRGSSNLRNWLGNFNFVLIDYTTKGGGLGIKVHRGFKNAVDALLPLYLTELSNLLNTYPDYNLIITGHSLGGAIATLSTLELQIILELNSNKLQLFTYGGPRVGNVEFAKFVNSQTFTLTRVVNNRDLVPHVPPRILNYSQNQREMFLHNNTAIICSPDVLEDPTCSLSKEPFLSIFNHLFYWDIRLGGSC